MLSFRVPTSSRSHPCCRSLGNPGYPAALTGIAGTTCFSWWPPRGRHRRPPPLARRAPARGRLPHEEEDAVQVVAGLVGGDGEAGELDHLEQRYTHGKYAHLPFTIGHATNPMCTPVNYGALRRPSDIDTIWMNFPGERTLLA